MQEDLRSRYTEVARRYESDVLRHAMRLCAGNLEWAKDLAQDAIVSGFTMAQEGKLDFDGNVKAWFLRVVTTRFINEYRRKKKWNSDVEIDKIDSHISSEPFESEDPKINSLFDEPLEKALRALPEEQRLCVLLIDVEEFSYQEASDYLQTPVGTIRSRLARGRLRLYSLLIPYAKSKGIIK